MVYEMLSEKRQHNPPHPGEILQESYIEDAGIGVEQLADRIGIKPSGLYDVLNKDRAITPGLALRLSVALNTSAKLWLNLQNTWDLWHEQKKHGAELVAIRPFQKLISRRRGSQTSVGLIKTPSVKNQSGFDPI